MSAVLLLHKGESGGELALEVDGMLVHARCDWPFDRETGEMISIRNEFPVEAFNEALKSVRASGDGRARGLDGGFVSFKARGGGLIEIDLTNRYSGFSAKSLSLRVPVTVEALTIDAVG